MDRDRRGKLTEMTEVVDAINYQLFDRSKCLIADDTFTFSVKRESAVTGEVNKDLSEHHLSAVSS